MNWCVTWGDFRTFGTRNLSSHLWHKLCTSRLRRRTRSNNLISPTFILQSSRFQEGWLLNPPRRILELLPRQSITANEGEAKKGKNWRQDPTHHCLAGNSAQWSTIKGLSQSQRDFNVQQLSTPSPISLLLLSVFLSITNPASPSCPGGLRSNQQLEQRLRKLRWSVERGFRSGTRAEQEQRRGEERGGL